MGTKFNKTFQKPNSSENFDIMYFLEKSDIKISKDYKVKSPPLMTNSFEEIREAIYIPNGEKRIIRIIPKYLKNKEELIEITKEISNIRSLSHKTIIKIHGFSEDLNYIYIIEEYFKGSQLIDFLKISVFSEKIAKKILSQILDFLVYFHKKENKIYCDLSLENIYWNGNYIKLKHFKNSVDCINKKKFSEWRGNPYYMSPEMIKGNYTQQTDIWSFGVLMFFLIKGETPFYGKSIERLINQISNYDLDLTNTMFNSEESKNLLMLIFIRNYHERISLTNIKNHPFFKID